MGHKGQQYPIFLMGLAQGATQCIRAIVTTPPCNKRPSVLYEAVLLKPFSQFILMNDGYLTLSDSKTTQLFARS